MDATTLLSSSIQPTGEEIRSARAQLAAEERKLLLLLADVEATRERIEALKRVVAPVRRVPPEILGEIIALSATAPGAPAQVLRTLSSVCRLWHDTTLRTPEAWTKIHFEYVAKPQSGPRAWLQTLPHVQEWFRNSGKSKKDVRIDVYAMPEEDVKALLDLISAHSQHLRVLAIDLIPAAYITMVETLLAKPMPSLEEWCLYGYKKPHNPQHSTAPALRRIRTSVHELNRISSPKRKQLTYLRILQDGPSDMVQFIDLCAQDGFPALRVLAIHSVGNVPQLPVHTEPIFLPALEAFHMPFAPEDVGRMTDLFAHLRMPNLATLSLCSALENFEPMRDYSDAHDASSLLASMLQTLIETSAPPLQRLYLKSLSLQSWDLNDVLKSLPLLRRLVLADMPITEGLNAYPSSEFLPQITHVYVDPEVRDPEYSPLNIGDVAGVLSRRDAGAASSRRTEKMHVRIGTLELVETDGKILSLTDQRQQDHLKHPRIFRDVYLPFDRWWRMDEGILGSDLEGL